MMFTGRQAILVTIAAAVLAATASACDATAGPPSRAASAPARPGANPLASLTSYQIVDRAFATTAAAVSVQVNGRVTRAAETTRLSSLSLVNGGSGCVADLYQYGIGTFQLFSDGTTAWVLPSPDYWAKAGAADAPLLGTLEGKYLELTPGAAGLGALTDLCSLSALAGTGPSPARKTGFGAPAPTTADGLPALKIADLADGGYAIVSDTAQPRLLRLYVPENEDGESLSFTYFTTPVTVTAPPSAEVVDGRQYPLSAGPTAGT
jgi:hypothetical protein